jgi:FkbM family methyltransferase
MKIPLLLFMIKFFRRLTNLEKIRYRLLKIAMNKTYFNGYFYALINHFECFQRSKNFSSKEVDTIEWIDGFAPDDIFFDIGANIGVYSLYAAKRVKEVFAFEPHFKNYYNLIINANLNNFSNLKPFCIAFDEFTGIGTFNHYKTNSGSSTSQLNRDVDHTNKKFHVKLKQSVLIETVTSFIERAKVFPNHIKIDVDGIELQIIKGFKQIIRDQRLKSVLVEITGEASAFETILLKEGFEVVNITPTDKKHTSFNYIFRRKGAEKGI